MTPTDIDNPDYFHKVVDCQWACPAHTPVPEYIRLIAAGRYGDAYMVNWNSNVFPGILGRTCDRPCEPACRRGRVEKEPVAICRLKRVAADNKDDITRPAAASAGAEERQARRADRRRPGLADRGARSRAARLSTSSSIDGDAQAGGMIRSQIPRFRLPESVIDEEVGYILDLRHRDALRPALDSLKALLAEGYDAIFVGSGAPRGRDLDIPGRKEAAANIHIGIDWLSQRLVRPHRQDRPARHRARRRQHRDGLLPHVAPPRRRRRQGHRALRLRGDEGVALGERGRDA